MTHTPANSLVWGEIPVTDLDRAAAFYAAVTGMTGTPNTTGPNPMVDFLPSGGAGVGLHLYPGTPASNGAGPTLHLSAGGALEDTMARVTEAGGTVVSPIVTIPPGRFFYAIDPDGNSVGLFETA